MNRNNLPTMYTTTYRILGHTAYPNPYQMTMIRSDSFLQHFIVQINYSTSLQCPFLPYTPSIKLHSTTSLLFFFHDHHSFQLKHQPSLLYHSTNPPLPYISINALCRNLSLSTSSVVRSK
jgi:hypothetical protein